MLGRRASRLAPPRHRRGARLGIPPPRRAPSRLAPPRHRRGARLGIPHTLRVLHAAACQRGLPARGTVRGRAAHPARCHDRAAIYPRALPGRRDARPPGLPARALPPLHPPCHTQYSRSHYPRALPTRHCPWRLATPWQLAPTLTALCRGMVDSGQSTPSETLRFSPAGFPKEVSLGEHATIWPCNRDNRWPSHAWL